MSPEKIHPKKTIRGRNFFAFLGQWEKFSYCVRVYYVSVVVVVVVIAVVVVVVLNHVLA